MKIHLVVFGLLVVLCFRAFAQTPAENALYETLVKGPDSVTALESVLKSPDERSTLILFTSASVALKEKRLEDSAFLYYAAQLRARFDKACFPPKGTGGSNPFLAIAGLSHVVGGAVNPAITEQPKVFAKALERVNAWSPKAPPGYDPGYEFAERKTEREAHAAVAPHRADFVRRMSDLATLLNDPAYFEAFKVVRTYNAPGEVAGRPSKEANAKATELMKRIEGNLGLEGFFNKKESTPLLQALASRDRATFVRLLESGADPNTCDLTGKCVMNQAAEVDDPFWLQKALEHDGDPNAVNVGNEHSPNTTPIFYAIYKERTVNVRLLIAAGADLNHRDSHWITPLRAAAGSGKYETVCDLLNANADPKRGDKHGYDLTNWFDGRNETLVPDTSPSGIEWFHNAGELLVKKGLLTRSADGGYSKKK